METEQHGALEFRSEAPFVSKLTGSDVPTKGPTDSNGQERRSRIRFPFHFSVRYRTLGVDPASGVGGTLDFSSHGILVQAPGATRPRIDEVLEAVVEWPILLNGITPIQFVALGRVVRTADQTFAISIARYEFRTTRKHSGSGTRDPKQR